MPVRQAAADLDRAIENAKWNARMKQKDDKQFANEFGNIVCNALVVKYQVDHGNSLMDYIDHNVRQDIHSIAAGHVKTCINCCAEMRTKTISIIIWDRRCKACATTKKKTNILTGESGLPFPETFWTRCRLRAETTLSAARPANIRDSSGQIYSREQEFLKWTIKGFRIIPI